MKPLTMISAAGLVLLVFSALFALVWLRAKKL
jgi:hypothetical protein